MARGRRTTGRLVIALLFVAVMLLAASGAWAVQARLTDDARTSSTKPTTNFGTGGFLEVSVTANSYLKFDLSTLPAGTSGGDVAKATLMLWGGTVAAPGSLNVHHVVGTWNEDTITPATAPALGGLEAAGVPVTLADQGSFMIVDLTAIVRKWIDALVPNNGIALLADTPGTSIRFDSKENTGTSHEPRLDITLRGAAAGGIPSGLMLFSDGGSCPGGFSLVTAYNDRFLVASASAGVTGGANSHTHQVTLTVPSHTHSLSNVSRGIGWNASNNPNNSVSDPVGAEHSAVVVLDYQSAIAEENGGALITSPSASADSRPAFVTLKLCRKD